jgi:hypothetical protein
LGSGLDWVSKANPTQKAQKFKNPKKAKTAKTWLQMSDYLKFFTVFW